jgi:Ca2+-binding EF-hand superfamily protein
MSRAQKTIVPTKSTPFSASKNQVLGWKDKLLPEEYEQLKNVFELFDEDHSGVIDPEEINKIMEELGESRKGTFAFGLIAGLKTSGKPINFE